MTALNKMSGWLIILLLISCNGKKKQDQFKTDLQSIGLSRGDIALCGADNGQFGTVEFGLSCSEKVQANFNLATALLHSFEYAEAEKVFAKVIDEDPQCVMAYWGAAMCSYHPLWAQPGPADLRKGSRIITLARSLESKTQRESDYLEAIAAIYDNWENLDHRTRSLRFEEAAERIYVKYPSDNEAAIFYALALRATADPTDKTFYNQILAGEILNKILVTEPDHPGIAHYIIHTYDYPELAELALPAARRYASIATASAHAQHMPSHIFTRLGLWDEAIQSNIKSIAAAQCYAQNTGIKGHWDEELHGMDYLLYAYLQKAEDEKAREQIVYLATIKDVFPLNFKDAYSFGAMPARFALERRNWVEAAALELQPADFPWDKYLWEKANIHFARLLGNVHLHKLEKARDELKQLYDIYSKLNAGGETYKASLLNIQIKTSEAWILLAEGHKENAISLMREAADMEDATEKDPVTPGEVIPARELLGDLYLETGNASGALEAFVADLKRHPNRFNGLYGAGCAEEKAGHTKGALQYYEQLLTMANGSETTRPQLKLIELYVRNNKRSI